MNTSEADRVEAQIQALKQLDLDGLRARWKTEFRRKAPEHLLKHLLLRIIAYHLQTQAFGGLSRETEQALDRIARSLQRGETNCLASIHPFGLRPGTVLVREHKGEMHSVSVGENSTFLWQGKTFKSLTKIAKAITGTNWNGPRFFGLRESKEGEAL